MPAVSTARIVAQYLMLLIGAIIFVIALYWAIETWFQIQPGNSAMGILVIYAAALGAGNLWFRREPQPASGRLWRVALICGLLTVALQGAIMGRNHFPVDMPRLVDFYMRGLLDLDSIIADRIPLEKINEGFEQMKKGDSARSVIVFDQ